MSFWAINQKQEIGGNTLQLDDLQQNVSDLTKYWTDATLESILVLLTEELGELARAVRKLGVKRWGHEDEAIGSRQDVSDEVGDVLFLLARIANITGVNLEDGAVSVLAKIEARLARSS
jgi:NTP pyrophosphatase (non-canonical NTP hydrolase)